jgi:ABC-type glycerol-3-phosphate transport system substrate-binding protein
LYIYNNKHLKTKKTQMKNLIFAIALVVTLASCGGSTTTQNDSATDSTTVQTTDTTTGTKVDTTLTVDSVKSVK